MVPDPRLSDKEMAAINAAAVTREYRVQPHLGMCPGIIITNTAKLNFPDYRTVSAING
jgi:hypothetical protein